MYVDRVLASRDQSRMGNEWIRTEIRRTIGVEIPQSNPDPTGEGLIVSEEILNDTASRTIKEGHSRATPRIGSNGQKGSGGNHTIFQKFKGGTEDRSSFSRGWRMSSVAWKN